MLKIWIQVCGEPGEQVFYAARAARLHVGLPRRARPDMGLRWLLVGGCAPMLRNWQGLRRDPARAESPTLRQRHPERRESRAARA